MKILFTSSSYIPPKRRPIKKIQITFKDGTVLPPIDEIKRLDATDVFIKTLAIIGLKTIFERANPMNRGEELLKDRQHTKHPEQSHQIGDSPYFISTYCSTEDKKRFLEDINQRLKLGMTVKLIEI